jgi:hypothetical protein
MYALNNPLRYTDASGELFNIFSWIGETAMGFIRGVGRAIQGKGIEHIFTDTWRAFANSMKIEWGLYKGTPKQILSRFTRELPQTILGNNWSHFRNYIGNVDKVRYFDGATYVINDRSNKNDGITLGSYININIKEKYDYDLYGKDGDFRPWANALFMHEYGHYIQSQEYGWNYLFKVGIPSLMSAMDSEIIGGNGNPDNITTHGVSWYERDANRRAALYFQKYGVNWKGKDFYKYPIGYPKFIRGNYNYLYIISFYNPDYQPGEGRK